MTTGVLFLKLYGLNFSEIKTFQIFYWASTTCLALFCVQTQTSKNAISWSLCPSFKDTGSGKERGGIKKYSMIAVCMGGRVLFQWSYWQDPPIPYCFKTQGLDIFYFTFQDRTVFPTSHLTLQMTFSRHLSQIQFCYIDTHTYGDANMSKVYKYAPPPKAPLTDFLIPNEFINLSNCKHYGRHGPWHYSKEDSFVRFSPTKQYVFTYGCYDFSL